MCQSQFQSTQRPRLLDVGSACSGVNEWAEAFGPLRDNEAYGCIRTQPRGLPSLSFDFCPLLCCGEDDNDLAEEAQGIVYVMSLPRFSIPVEVERADRGENLAHDRGRHRGATGITTGSTDAVHGVWLG